MARTILWYRMVAGGRAPRYVRLRPRATLSAAVTSAAEQTLAAAAYPLIERVAVEILNLRPTMSYGISQAQPR
jgi:hypothetical protein